jgi:ABC-type nitrate/sulfonate/bicarbonate transport system substrate-binding protein
MTDTLKTSTFSRNAVHDHALANGFYDAEDLAIEVDITQASKTQMAQLRDGVWDIVSTNFDNVMYWGEDHGADFLVVSALDSLPRQDLVVRPEIQTYEDFRGKVIAVDAAESGYVTPLRILLSNAGLKEDDDYTLVEYGATNGRVAAMAAGDAYGAMVSEGRALEDGMWVMDAIGRLYTHYASIVVVRREWAEANELLLLRYLRAHLGATASLKGSTDMAFAWAGLKEMMEMRKDVGFLRGEVDPTRFATEHYFEQARPR